MIKYTFFDDCKNKIAVVYEGTSQEEINELLKTYDEVIFKEY